MIDLKKSLVFILFIVALLCPLPANANEYITYEMKWFIGADGTNTKIYIFKYEGPQTLSRLQTYTKHGKSVYQYIENSLPYIDGADILLSQKQLGVGTYELIFEGSKQPDSKKVEKTVLTWLPVLEDPMNTIWEEDSSSKYLFKSRELTITTKITVRTPWNFEYREPDRSNEFKNTGYHVEFSANQATTSDSKYSQYSGWNLPGIALKSTITSKPEKLDLLAYDKLVETREKYTLIRKMPNVQAFYPRGKSPSDINSSIRAGAIFRYGLESIRTKKESVNRQALVMHVSMDKSLSKNIFLKFVELEFMAPFPAGYLVLATNSLMVLRFPFFGHSFLETPAMYIFDIYTGPGYRYTYGKKISNDTFHDFRPVIYAGVRLGYLDYGGHKGGLGQAIDARFYRYIHGKYFDSGFMLSIELFR